MVALEDDIKNCIQVLTKGGTVLYPTDTIWGLGCDAMNKDAIEKIFAIKQRPRQKSLIILLADARDVLKYVASPPPDIIDILENFERPTTVIYSNALDLPENAINENGSIAIRVTKDPFCKALIKRFRNPLVSTSANITGQKTAPLFSMIDSEIISQVDYVVKYRQDDNIISEPSTIIRINDEGIIETIR